MTWVYPTAEARITTRLGVERGFFGVASVFTAGGLVAAFIEDPTGPVFSALSLLALWSLLLVALRWRQIPLLGAVAVLAVGAVFLWVLVSSVPESPSFVVSCGTIVMIGLGSNLDRWTGAVGTIAGFVAAQAVMLFAPDGPILDLAGLIVALCIATYYAVLVAVRGEGRSVAARLDQAARSELAAAERRALELQSRALLHDTVLGELAAIGLMRPGPLSAHARDSIRSSLDVVRAPLDPERVAALPHIALSLLVDKMAAAGLAVDVTGDTSALDQLSPDAREALLLALDQALVNVATHAQTSTAELSIITSGHTVVVTVVDDGVGFDEKTIAPDRFGFRESIHGRVDAVGGSVRILSSPGQGTSIVLMFDVPEVSS